MEHDQQTIEHLRGVIKELQIKIDSRTRMLADILPHLLACEQYGDDLDYFLVHEWYERHSMDAAQFKEEYAKETGISSSIKSRQG